MDAARANHQPQAMSPGRAMRTTAPRMVMLHAFAGALSVFAVIMLLLGIASAEGPLQRPDYCLLAATAAAAIACLLLFLLLGRVLRRVARIEAELRREREQAETHAARWQFALDSAGDGLWDWNGETGEVFVSTQWKAMLGYLHVDDVLSLGTWAELVHPEDRERAIAIRNDCLAGRLPMLTSEQRVRCADGSYKWVLNRGKVTARDANGRALRMVGTQIDLTDRRAREAVERANEERLKFALDSAEHGIWDYRIDANSVFLSPRLKAMLELDDLEENVTYEYWFERLHPADRTSTLAALRRHLEQEVPTYEAEFRVRCRNEQWKWVSARGRVIEWDDGGKPTRLIGTYTDIDSRKAVETELRHSDERLQRIAARAPGLIFEFRMKPDGSMVTPFVNENIRTLFGLTPEDVRHDIGPIMALIHPEDLQGFWESVLESARQVGPWHREFRARHPDGSMRWLRGDATANAETDGSIFWNGYISDITASKAAEDTIRREKAFVESLVQNLVTPTFVVNPDGTVRIWNRAIEELSGYRAAEIVGTHRHREAFYGYERVTLADLVLAGHAPAKDDPYVKIETLSNVPGGLYSENWCPLRDGSTRYLAGAAGPIHHADGTLAAVVETMHDLTAQQKMQSAIAQARDEALAATRAKSAFLANMSHEIRTPMNGVLGMAGLLLDTALDAEQRQYAETLAGSARHLLGVINDILDFSKIEARRLELDAVDFDLREIIEEAVTAQAQPAFEKGLELCTEFDPALPMCLRGDEGRLRQMLMNLIGNAVKFTHTGSVTVGARLIDDDAQAVRFRIEVTDTGIGIPSEHLSTLFAAFAQGDSSMSRRFGGSGLGLAICRELVTLMGGEIGCDTALDIGSTFWFTLRLPRAANTFEVVRAPWFEPTLRVLVGDDNPLERRLVAELIAACGLSPLLVRSAEAVLAELEGAARAGQPYALAVIEQRLGSEGGGRLAERIRSAPELAATHCLMLTIPGTRDTAPGAGVSFLQKPVRRVTLWRALQSALEDRPATVAEARGSAADMPPAPRRGRLLVVEDNLTNRQVARATLDKLGYDVDLAEDGVAAIQALAAQDYDLVLMDCQMPVMDGYAATRAIRDPASRVRNHAVPIIAMTAHALANDREECLAAGMNDYLSKPIVPDLMKQMFERWLKPRGAAADGSADPAAPVADAMIFDRMVLLDRLMGDEALLAQILAAFKVDAATACQQLAAAVEAGDTDEAARLCHTLKGTAANIGAIAVRDLALELEATAKHRDIAALRGALPVLQAALASFRRIANAG